MKNKSTNAPFYIFSEFCVFFCICRQYIYNLLLRTLVVGALLFCLGQPKVHAQQVTIKTNGLMWLAMMPNAGCEFVVGERSTVDLSAFGSMNIWGNKAKILGFQPEYRYWFNGRPMTREYVGVGALATSYDITWGEKVYEGDAGGIGLTFGYVLNFGTKESKGKGFAATLHKLGRRLNVEFYAGCGLVFFQQKQYFKGDHFDDYTGTGAVQANAKGYKLLPIKLGVAVSWILK